MQHAALVERFNAVSEALDAHGDRIIVRRARGLLETGDAQRALDFLEEAGRRHRDATLTGLAEALAAWRRGGGDTAALITDPEWVRGAAQEQHRSRLIAHAIAAPDLGRLSGALASQQLALAREEPIPELPTAETPPGHLPPLPRFDRPAAAPARHDAPQPLAAMAPVSVAAPSERRPKAIVEAPSTLTERTLRLEESPAPGGDDEADPFGFASDARAEELSDLDRPVDAFSATETFDASAVSASVAESRDRMPAIHPVAPAEAAAAPLPATPKAPAPAAPDTSPLTAEPAAPSAPSPTASVIDFEHMPNLAPPPSMPEVSAPKKPAQGKRTAYLLAILLVLAGGAAAAFFLLDL